MCAGQIISTTKGLTWGAPTDLNALMPAGRGNMVAGEGPGATQLSLDHPTHPGRLLFIGHKWSPSGNYTGPPDPFAYVWWSDDGGKTRYGRHCRFDMTAMAARIVCKSLRNGSQWQPTTA
jgi:hypothetical protein